jgi:hypothetical protein
METHPTKRIERQPVKKEDNNLDRLYRRNLHHSRLLLMFLIMTALMTTTAYATTPPVTVPPGATDGPSAIPPATSTEPYQYAPDAAVPLTPEGNLTLLDDVQTNLSGNLQFLTVRTKAGNTFYLIVDRSAEQNNVHFLNLVDEADLLTLLKNEEGFGATNATGAVPNGVTGAMGSPGATGATGTGTATGEFTMQWPSASDKSNAQTVSPASDSGSKVSVPDSGSANQGGDGQYPDAGSEAISSANNMQTSQPGQSAQSGESAAAPASPSGYLPFTVQVTAYLSLALILLLVTTGAVIWLVRRHRKKKQLRAKHPLDEYLYVEEMEEREEAEPSDSADTHSRDRHLHDEEFDGDGEEDLV